VDRLHHAFEQGIEKLARVFRITIGEELCRSFQVGEEDRHLFSLAFERGLGVQDFLGEMPRGVRIRRDKSGLMSRMSALRAKLGRRRQLAAAVCAGASERGGALLAKLRPASIFVPALGALHNQPSPWQSLGVVEPICPDDWRQLCLLLIRRPRVKQGR
jgi:hypothetical protein